jgi:hypothetical protein
MIFGMDILSRNFSSAALGMRQWWDFYGVWTMPLFYLVWIPVMIDMVMVCSLPA